jgi:hypothetical protein
MTLSDKTRVNEKVVFKQKSISVVKWNLKFTGESGSLSVAAFFERVEELKVARGINDRELHDSAVDLFEGQALVWYRSVRRRVNSWEELKK